MQPEFKIKKSPYFFIDPPQTIGEVLERGSSLEAQKEYTVILPSEQKQRKILFAVVFVFLALFFGVLTFAVFESTLLAFVVYGFALIIAFLGAVYMAFYESDILSGFNYFVGTEGGYLTKVRKNWQNVTEQLYLYDEIEDIKKQYTIVKQSEGDGIYYPKAIKAEIHIKQKGQKGEETHRFELDLVYDPDSDSSRIVETDGSNYHLYRFFESLMREWSERRRIQTKKDSTVPNPTLEDALQESGMTPDPAFELSLHELPTVVTLSLLFAIALYVWNLGDYSSFFEHLIIMGFVGGVIAHYFYAASDRIRLLQWALFFDFLWGVLGLAAVHFIRG